MIETLKSLDNREFATSIWIGLFIVWCITKPDIRKSSSSLLSAVVARPILIAFSLAVAYLLAITLVLRHFDLWTLKQFKITVLWFFVAGIPALSDIPNISKKPTLLKTAAAKNFKITLLLDFFINLFKLPLLAELIFVPLTALLGGMLAVAQGDDKYAPVQKFLNGIFIAIGIGLIAFESYKVLTSLETISNFDTLRDFVLPIIYNVVFIPLLWAMSIYAAYESVFCRLRFVMKDHSLHSYAKRQMIIGFRTDIGALNEWFNTTWTEEFTSRRDIAKSIAGTKFARDMA